MATVVLVRGKTLPDSGVKKDLHDLIDLTTASVSNIVNADIDTNAAIAGTKVSPNFGSQSLISGDVTTGAGTFTGAIDAQSTLDVTGLTTLANLTVDGVVIMGGAEVSKSQGTTYQAETDGFFYGIAVIGANNSGGKSTAYVSSTQSDVDSQLTSAIRGAIGTARADGTMSQSAYSDRNSFKVRVNKDHYYRAAHSSTGTVTFTYYWQPIG